MAVQCILGPAGSGKSTYVRETIAAQLQQNRQKRIILIVPEQATFCYQSELIQHSNLSGVLTVEILSFQRLARILLQQTGGLARKHIDSLGKLLILRRLLQESTEQYPFLMQSMHRPGYLLKLGETFQELKRYQISSLQLQQTAKQVSKQPSILSSKLQELSALYSRYTEFLAQDCMDSEDLLDLLCERLKTTESLRETDFWVDEFYDFTPQEYAILAELMACAANLYVLLPYASDRSDLCRRSVFHGTEKILQRLRGLAAEKNIPIYPDRMLEKTVRWEEQTPLSFLERQHFSIHTVEWDGVPQGMELIQGQNRLSEVDAVARKIRQLCREEGYRYHEIGIFTRGDQYDLLLETILSDYEIPYFVDHKETVRQHPLTEWLLSALEIVQKRWNYQSMFRFLKTGLLPFPEEDLDRLENYVLQHGIQGSRWYQEADWRYGNEETEDLGALNALRRQIVVPLYTFQKAVAEPQTAEQYVRQLYQLLETFSVPKQLESLCQEALELKQLEAVQVHQQVWDHVVQIFNQMTQLLQEQPLSCDAFAVLLSAAFDSLDLGLLPNGLDQVFVGAIAHSRSRTLKAAFVLGLNEGVFPAKTNPVGFFTDLEKQLLRQMGMQLSPDSREQLYEEQFLVYLALTRASSFLQLSYSLCDEEGKALRPSEVVQRLHRCFPAWKEQPVQWPPNTVQELLPYLSHPTKAMGLLGSHLVRSEETDAKELWSEVYNWFLQHPTPLFSHVCRSLHHEKSLGERQLASTQIYGTPLHVSVSALERYRQCPYSYFLTYGLRIKERALYQMQAVDIGQFYHAAVEQFSTYFMEQQLRWQELTEEKVIAIMDQVVEQLTPMMQNEILLSSGRYRYLQHRLKKNLERSAVFLLEHGKKGDFVPVALEVDFGMAHSKLPQWKITLQDGTQMVLQGRIDRIEQATDGTRHYLRIIDFKSGTQGLQLSDIYYGLKIQLLTYLQVAFQYYQQLLPPGEELLPAGVLYYFFRSGVLRTDGPLDADTAKQKHFSNMRAKGLLVADLRALTLAERTLSTGSSVLLPCSLLTKAAPYLEDPDTFWQLEDPMSIFSKRSNAVITREQLGMLLLHVQKWIRHLGEEIHRGNIAVRPCRISSFVGCQYCTYQAICQIQTVDLQKNSEELPSITAEEIWQRLVKEEGGELQ